MNKNTKKILIPSTYLIIFTVILIIFEGLSSTGLAFYEGKAIDVITIGSSNKIMVNKLAITIALCFTVQWLSSVFAPYFQRIIFIKRIEILREEIVKSVLNASVSDIDRFETGDIHLRLTKNLNNINYFFSDILYIFVRRMVIGVSAVLTAFIISRELAVLEFFLLPFIIMINVKINDSMEKNFYLMDEYYGKIANILENILRLMQTIKIYKADFFIKKRFENSLKDIYSENKKNNRIIIKKVNFLTVINYLPVIIHYIVGVILIYNKNITLGTFVTFGLFRSYVSNFLDYFPNFILKYHEMKASVKRLNELINLNENKCFIKLKKIELQDDKDIIISGKNISFSYSKEKNFFLNNININIYNKKINVITGKSGSGKTTLLHLLSGIYPVEKGEVIYYLNKDEKKMYIKNNFKDKILYVGQHDFLFIDTILNNLTLGSKEIDIEKVVEICKLFDIHNSIMKLDKGYETVIGEKNTHSLSGGEIRRLSIARACLRKPEILFLDEPTSSLDHKTEKKIIDIVEKMRKNTTFIISSHSLSFIERADKLFIIK